MVLTRREQLNGREADDGDDVRSLPDPDEPSLTTLRPWTRGVAMAVAATALAVVVITFSFGSSDTQYSLTSGPTSGPTTGADSDASGSSRGGDSGAGRSGPSTDEATGLDTVEIDTVEVDGSDVRLAALASVSGNTTTTPTTQPPTTSTTSFTEPVIEPESQWIDAGNGVAVPDVLLRIRFCESTNNYRAAHAVSSARGAYQFLSGSWSSYGHAARYGVSTADQAAPAQQDEAAVITFRQSGTRPWKASYSCWASPSINPNYASIRPPTTTATTAPSSTTTSSTTTSTESTTTTSADDATTSTTESTTTAESTTTTTEASSSTDSAGE